MGGAGGVVLFVPSDDLVSVTGCRCLYSVHAYNHGMDMSGNICGRHALDINDNTKSVLIFMFFSCPCLSSREWFEWRRSASQTP